MLQVLVILLVAGNLSCCVNSEEELALIHDRRGPHSSEKNYSLFKDNPSRVPARDSSMGGPLLDPGAQNIPEHDRSPRSPAIYARFNIGAVLMSNKTERHFQKAVEEINFDGRFVGQYTTLYDVCMRTQNNLIRSALLFCNHIVANSVYAVVVEDDDPHVTAALSFAGGFVGLPVVHVEARGDVLSDKNLYPSFLRTVPPCSHQADVWLELLKTLQYKQVVFIHSSDTNGRALLERFIERVASDNDCDDIKILEVVEFNPSQNSLSKELKHVKAGPSRVLLLAASRRDASMVFQDALSLNMSSRGYVWLVTEEALSARLAPPGILGVRLRKGRDPRAHITDSLKVLALALQKLRNESHWVPDPPNSCDNEDFWETTGRKLYSYIIDQELDDGETGKVAFDENGDRLFASYDVINVQETTRSGDREKLHVPVGEYRFDEESKVMGLSLVRDRIVWSGGDKEQPTGFQLATHLKVMTIREAPFVFAEAIKETKECYEDEVVCTWTDSETLEKTEHCCFGYCVDLLRQLASINSFTFELALSPDGQFGEFVGDLEDEVEEEEEAKGKTGWSGLIGELVNQTHGADMIVAPLTINPERAQVIDFTKPFKYQGITILVRKHTRSPALVSILQPFKDNLWIFILISIHVVTFFIWLLDFCSPGRRYAGDDTSSFNMAGSFWFTWGVILNSGLSDGSPRSLSARVLAMVFAGFTMIVVASYTANLAAFLVLEESQATVTGIGDPKFRNPMDSFKFATIIGSSVDAFFKGKAEWTNMYRSMQEHSLQDVSEAVEAVRNGSLQAFIWDSSRLEYDASQNCELVTVGDYFGRSGYGVGLRKGSPWTEKITTDILQFHENGFMEKLDTEWIWGQYNACVTDYWYSPSSSQTLGLWSMEGIFMIVTGGVLIGCVFILCEIGYSRIPKKKRIKEDEHSSSQVQVRPLHTFSVLRRRRRSVPKEAAEDAGNGLRTEERLKVAEKSDN